MKNAEGKMIRMRGTAKSDTLKKVLLHKEREDIEVMPLPSNVKGKPSKHAGLSTRDGEKYWTSDRIANLGRELIVWFQYEEEDGTKPHIWLKDFAIEQGIPSWMLPMFAKENDEFKWFYAIAKDIQESNLFKLGLDKRFNASMPMLALTNICGWQNKNQVEHSGGLVINNQQKKTKEIYSDLEKTLEKYNIDLDELGIDPKYDEQPKAEVIAKEKSYISASGNIDHLAKERDAVLRVIRDKEKERAENEAQVLAEKEKEQPRDKQKQTWRSKYVSFRSVEND